MINADLASRSCGYTAIFAALLAFGILRPAVYEPVLGENFQQVSLQISVQQAGEKAKADPVDDQQNKINDQNTAADPEQEIKAPAPEEVKAPEPVPEPEPVKTPAPKQEIRKETPTPKVKPEPVKQTAENHQPQAKQASRNTAPKKTAAAAANEVKSGDRAGSAAGSDVKAGAQSGPSQAELLSEARAFASNEIISLIKSRSTYPRQALRRKVQGTVMIEFTLDKGVITAYKLAQSSGSSILDRAALQLADSLVGFKSSTPYSLKLQVPLRYALK